MNARKKFGLVLGLVFLALSAALGQEAEIPFYAERFVTPNVTLFIDSSGSMDRNGEIGVPNPRSRIQIVRDVLTGREAIPIYYTYNHTDYPTYVPHTDDDKPADHTVYEDIDAALVHIFRVNDNWEADINGQYFVFWSPEDTNQQDPDSIGAKTTLDAYMREMNVDPPCIKLVDTRNVTNDGIWSDRQIWSATDVCGGTTTMTFGEAFRNYYNYEETGVVGGSQGYVVPVYYVPADRNAVWTWPDGTTVFGQCYAYYQRRRLRWHDCFKPTNDPSSPYIVNYGDVAGVGAEDIENSKVAYQDWLAAQGNPEAVCLYAINEVWGDRPYSEWWYDWNLRPRSDGNTLTRLGIWTPCSLSDPGAIPTDLVPDDDTIRNDLISRLPYVKEVDAQPDKYPDLEDEFIKNNDPNDGTRIDIYLRQKLGINPANPNLNLLDLDDPFFGGFFEGLEYDDGKEEFLGIMDLYPDVNYGLLVFDNNGSCGGDDFPEDDSGHCYGADLLVNVTSWADFPAYPDTSSKEENQKLQDFIADKRNGVRPNGGTPIASSLHDIYRFFWNTDMQGHSPNPSPFFDLGYPEPNGSESDHIYQGDPFYINECRRNYLIYLTDGNQTMGEPIGHYSNTWSDSELATIIATQQHWVHELWAFGGPPYLVKGMKSYFIGFGEALTQDEQGVAEVTAMAEASDLPDDPNDIAYPFFAENEDYLFSAFAEIMNNVMQGQYARAAPVIDVMSEGELEVGGEEVGGVILTTYFDIGVYKLWSGHLLGWKLPEPGSTDVVPLWTSVDPPDAGLILNDTDGDSRNLFSATGDPLDTFEFTAGNVISYYENTDYLNYYKDWNPDGDIGDKVVAVIRGSSGATFSDGDSVDWKLGPIVHSQPKIVSRPQSDEYIGMTGYDEFMNAHQDRPPMVFVGTGHGVLEAFDLATGEEVFGYIPDGVVRNLPFLWQGTQIYGVDGTPVVDDVYADFDDDGNPEWKTLLMVGLGQGGTTYSVLDITDLDNVYSSDVAVPLWNFRDENLGFTTSTPVMGFINYEDEVRVAAFFGGGLNNTGSDTEDPTPGVGASFYIVDMTDGTALKKFELPSVSSGSTNLNNVPGGPIILDKDGDGKYDWAYVGDTDGQLWKIKFHSADPDDWVACKLYDVTDTNYDGTPGDDESRRQPIWYTPALALGPNDSILVYFATGHIETNKVTADTDSYNFLFAILDTDTVGNNECSYGQELTDEIAGGTVGFPIQFEQGEKVIDTPLVAAGLLLFKTYLPTSTEACAAGKVRFWVVDYLTGTGVWDLSGDAGIDSYMEAGSYSNLTLGPEGELYETCTSRECLGEFKKLAQLPPTEPSVMSWGEGVEVPF